MKKSTKKLLSLMLSVILMFSVVPFAFAAESAKTVQSGVTSGNDNIKWTLDEKGVLTVSGKGKLSNYWTFGKVGIAISGNITVKDLFEIITKYGNTEAYVKDVKKIVIGEGITSVGNANFTACVNAEEIVLPSTLTSIGKNAFAYTSVSELKIPATVTTIGESAFYGTKLKSVTFADKTAVKTIDKLAFAKTSLSSFTVPATVESLAADACAEIADFKGYNVAAANTKYSSYEGVLSSKDGSVLMSYPNGSAKTEYTIGSRVKTVKAGAFANKNLVTLTIPSGVKTMEKGAFECPALREVYNLSSVKLTPGSDANGGAAKYAAVVHTSLYEPSGFYSIGDYKFVTDGKNHTLYSYEGSEVVLSLPTDFAFRDLSVMSYSIGKNAFAKSNVTAVVIPAEVKNIESGAFADCLKLQTVSFAADSKLVSVGDSAFKNDNELILISLPIGVKTIGKNAFDGCKSLISFELPASVTSVGDAAFSGCEAMNMFSVTGDSELKSIGKAAFKGDKALKAIALPEKLETIGDEAFAGCEKISEANIPASVKSIGAGAFADCSKLGEVTFPYDSAITEIKTNTFKNCTSIEKIIVPKSVEKIGEDAFSGCIAMQEIYICNKDCSVDSSKNTIPSDCVIFGYPVSGAKNYALLRLRDFKNIKSVHIWSEATCTKPSVCYICGEKAAEPKEHSFSEWTVVTAVTCTENGLSERTCSVCGAKETMIVPALGHSYSAWGYVTDPISGIQFKERICNVCGHKHIQSIAVIDDTNPPVEPGENYIIGDVDGNGTITANDARIALRIAANLDKHSYVEFKAADVDLSGKVTASDARKILRVSAKLESFD